ncbi:TonB-dependent receptor [Mucilaginibacter auburnensis]|uniref:Outer membrane receptor for ferrienterochelin and colicins n=1 Tax=Mucilaginibacter auburnensis TaxID=1457233 RepID=A0A2H9VW25_9SPHI|nr:TonB-dependent receptor [Mucilaginibacter auburnensis]PJJ85017.1 outer membrane receptor for ferrienterochelin and colicins [Mucilaginibacter auburnensis]
MIKYLLLLLLILLLFGNVASSQSSDGTIQGRVVTSDNRPAAGVTIEVANSRLVAVSHADGRFTLKLRTGSYILQFKALGMLSTQQQVTVTANSITETPDVKLKVSSFQLRDVVVTGQYAPQSMKNSVYMVRSITSEQMRLRNPAKVQDVLTDQLGVRFTNDLTLGTTSITLQGVAGQRVKLLLDGVPLLDRGDTRESLNQIDVNTIDHIEIVDGPMSVSYGSDALGGVINLITKKGRGGESLLVYGRVQEETAGKKYQAFDGPGTHHENVGINWEHNGWQLGGNITRNNFDGASLGWIPKDQYLGSGVIGYRTRALNLWYRFDGVDETLLNSRIITASNVQIDQKYLTNRFTHQLQAEWQINNQLSFNGAASYTDYSRRTQTTSLDLLTGDRRLTLGDGEQDKSVFDTKLLRGTAQYKLNNSVSFQPGLEFNLTGSSGARITGTPTINDYAFFISSEIRLSPSINVRPGVRFTKNSVYDAPPAIPSINTKIKLSNSLDLRLAYGRGFRAPALRELYFNFFDASHSIMGNDQLKAEYSHSVNGSLTWQKLNSDVFSLRSSIGGFYNYFDNLITTGFNPVNPAVTTYININKYKTTGATFENTFGFKNLQAKVGFSYTGIYNEHADQDPSLPGFTWYPEVNSNILYSIKAVKTELSFFYKYNGKLPTYELIDVGGKPTIKLAQRSAFHIGDFTVNKYINKVITLSGGVKNIFNVTNVFNTSANIGGAHSTGGPVPMGYGRSYFLGLTFQYNKN